MPFLVRRIASIDAATGRHTFVVAAATALALVVTTSTPSLLSRLLQTPLLLPLPAVNSASFDLDLGTITVSLVFLTLASAMTHMALFRLQLLLQIHSWALTTCH